MNTDVTERRSIQLQLLRVQRLESIGTLAGGIAHDLNNVLTPILMGLEGLSLQHSDQGTRRILEIMKTTVQRGASIVRQVLSFARGIEGERAEVQLKHVLREIAQIIEETFPRSIEIRSRCRRICLPSCGDVTQIHQVLMNLCVNARDAMPDGGTLTLSAESVRLEEVVRPDAHRGKAHPHTSCCAWKTRVREWGPRSWTRSSIRSSPPRTRAREPASVLPPRRSIVKSHGGFINVYSEARQGELFQGISPGHAAGERGSPARASSPASRWEAES